MFGNEVVFCVKFFHEFKRGLWTLYPPFLLLPLFHWFYGTIPGSHVDVWFVPLLPWSLVLVSVGVYGVPCGCPPPPPPMKMSLYYVLLLLFPLCPGCGSICLLVWYQGWSPSESPLSCPPVRPVDVVVYLSTIHWVGQRLPVVFRRSLLIIRPLGLISPLSLVLLPLLQWCAIGGSYRLLLSSLFHMSWCLAPLLSYLCVSSDSILKPWITLHYSYVLRHNRLTLLQSRGQQCWHCCSALWSGQLLYYAPSCSKSQNTEHCAPREMNNALLAITYTQYLATLD